MAKRKSTGKRQRFEIFKRDGFKCAYCGRSPPEVLLHVDHVQAVANGGTDDPTNLVTACADCNGGKSAVPLNVVAPSLQQQAEDAAERAEQVRAYSALLAELRSEAEDQARKVWDAFSDSLAWPADLRGRRAIPNADDLRSIRHFLTKLTVTELLDAVDITAGAAARGAVETTFDRHPDGRVTIGLGRQFRYFCGVVWRTIRQREARGW